MSTIERPVPVGRAGMRAVLNHPRSALAIRTRRALTARAIAAVRESRPDAVIVIRGDLLGGEWWEQLDHLSMPRVTWFYDELRRMRYDEGLLDEIGPLATYSPIDAKDLAERGLDSHHVPLGFDALQPISARDVRGVSFIGARYPGREHVLRSLAAHGVDVVAFGRDWSRHPVDVLRSGQFTHPGVRAERELPRSLAYGAMQGSAATMNLHGDQDGFTMRTFEAAGVGGVQICDRSDVSEHYDVGTELLTFAHLDELVELCRRTTRDVGWADGLRVQGQRRTLAEHTLAHRLRRLEGLWA